MRLLLVAAALFGLVLAGPAPKIIPLPEDEDDAGNATHFLVETSPGVYEIKYLANPELDTITSEDDLVFHHFQEYEDDGENMRHFLVETSPGVYEVEDLVNAELDTTVSEDDLVYHYFSQEDPKRGYAVQKSNIDSLDTLYSCQRDSMFIIHGWLGNNRSKINYRIKKAILSKHDINVFVVDWSPIAGRNYKSAKGSVVKVGQYVADFIESLEEFGLSMSQVTLVGFSLGAQVAGNIGAALDGEVDHIVGLDPAGPLFSVKNIDERLDPTDGKYVHVIHTNGGWIGFKAASGHSDYYPNGGSSQPGCGLDIGGACSHIRAYLYYTESISASDNGFVAYQCSSYEDYNLGKCAKNTEAVMGGYTIDKRAFGKYYLYTNEKSPYAKYYDVD